MASSITFLGTAGDAVVVSRQLRSSGGFVIISGDTQLHIDPGPGALVKCFEYGINPRATTALLVSHAHINHSNDANAIIAAMTYGGFDKRGVLIANKTVISGAEEYLPAITSFHKNCLERLIIMEPNQKVAINDIEIMALRAKHSEPNTIGFKFFTPEYTLSYTSDTKYFAEISDQLKNSNILILNVVSTKKEDAKDNLCTEDAVKIIKEVKPKLAIIQHFGVNILKEDPLFITREMQKETGIHLISAKDGMSINPISYSADRGQKTLRAYPVKPEQEVEVKEIGKL